MAYGFAGNRKAGKQDIYVRTNYSPKTNDNYTVMQGETEVSQHRSYADANAAATELRLTNAKASKRTIYTTGEIPHLWAHQAIPEAKNSGRNLYFEGATIYSYGSHFPVARHVTGKAKNSHAILFTTHSYSVTTSKHCSAVRSAIPEGIKRFDVPNIAGRFGESSADMHAENLHSYASRITDAMQNFARARKAYAKDGYRASINEWMADAKAYAKFFGLPAPKLPKLPKDWSKLAAQLRSESAKQAAIERKRKAEKQAQLVIENAERIARWRNGENVSVPYDIPTMLRIKEVTTDGDTSEMVVQTSRGASVPLDHARRALAFVRRVMTSGTEYKRNGHTFHIGHYQIDRVTTDGTLYAGCHVITWDEIQRIESDVERDR